MHVFGQILHLYVSIIIAQNTQTGKIHICCSSSCLFSPICWTMMTNSDMFVNQEIYIIIEPMCFCVTSYRVFSFLFCFHLHYCRFCFVFVLFRVIYFVTFAATYAFLLFSIFFVCYVCVFLLYVLNVLDITEFQRLTEIDDRASVSFEQPLEDCQVFCYIFCAKDV